MIKTSASFVLFSFFIFSPWHLVGFEVNHKIGDDLLLKLVNRRLNIS